MYYEQKFLKRAHFNRNTCLISLMLGKPRAHNERTFAQTSVALFATIRLEQKIIKRIFFMITSTNLNTQKKVYF